MWGRLVDLASAAAEQVQKEAINIANDGFDLLDKLDSTMNNTEDEERIKNDASSELGDMEPSGEVIASVPKQLETFNAPLEIKKEDEASPVVLSIKSTPEQPKKSPVKKGTLSPLTKTASPPKPQPQPLETEDPAAQRALAELKSVLWCSPSASMQEVLVRVREVLDESGEQAQVIRGLSETLDARESAHRAEITELKEKLVQSNGRVSVLEAALDETEKRPQELAPSSISKIASLQSDLSSALDRVSALEAAAAESQSRWSREEAELLAKCAALESKREELARDLLAKESELQGVLEKLNGSNESITSLNTRIEALASELRSAEASHIAKEQEHARQLEVSAEANRTLTQKLADARKQQKSKVAAQNNNIDVINKLKAEMAEAVERVSMLERLKSEETASLQAQISALTEARAADERSIAELRLQMQEKSSALEALSSTPPPPPQEVTSEAPTTPVRPSNASQLTGSESPDDSSFKTPGPAPKSGVGKGKLRAKGKSKAEVTDEIKTLSSQLHSLKAMQVRWVIINWKYFIANV
jgi:chromosome segregation ATPase